MRYVDREENADYVVDLMFDALSFDEIHTERLSPPRSQARLSVRARHAGPITVIDLGDVSVPSAPWFGARLMALMDEALFVGVGNGLLLLDLVTKTIAKHIVTANTEVTQILPDHDRRRIYVVNEAFGIITEGDASNIAAFDEHGALAWRAPMAAESWSDVKGYTQIMALNRGMLEVTTWTGRCHLDADDGRVIDCWFTKGS